MGSTDITFLSKIWNLDFVSLMHFFFCYESPRQFRPSVSSIKGELHFGVFTRTAGRQLCAAFSELCSTKVYCTLYFDCDWFPLNMLHIENTSQSEKLTNNNYREFNLSILPLYEGYALTRYLHNCSNIEETVEICTGIHHE